MIRDCTFSNIILDCIYATPISIDVADDPMADPKRVGLVSDRDVADFYAASKVICRGVEAWK